VRRFFGLTLEDKANVTLESVFNLIYYGGFTFTEAWKLPISYRQWFINRISKEMNKGGEGQGAQSRATHQNTSDVRSLQGMTRAEGPSRTRRFT
jgi:hypothetical protein